MVWYDCYIFGMVAIFSVWLLPTLGGSHIPCAPHEGDMTQPLSAPSTFLTKVTICEISDENIWTRDNVFRGISTYFSSNEYFQVFFRYFRAF